MALSPEQRVRHARHLSLLEIGEAGQERLCATRFRVPAGADERAAAAAREYLTRAGMVEARDAGSLSMGDAVALHLPTPDEVQRLATAPLLEPAAACVEGARAAVDAIRATLDPDAPGPRRPTPPLGSPE
jgi:hypothetical protein